MNYSEVEESQEKQLTPVDNKFSDTSIEVCQGELGKVTEKYFARCILFNQKIKL